jgi:hypothetical protein
VPFSCEHLPRFAPKLRTLPKEFLRKLPLEPQILVLGIQLYGSPVAPPAFLFATYLQHSTHSASTYYIYICIISYVYINNLHQKGIWIINITYIYNIYHINIYYHIYIIIYMYIYIYHISYIYIIFFTYIYISYHNAYIHVYIYKWYHINITHISCIPIS